MARWSAALQRKQTSGSNFQFAAFAVSPLIFQIAHPMRIETTPNGRPHLKCAKCRMFVIWPADLLPQTKATFAATVRNDSVSAMRYAESEWGLDYRESKVLVLHVTREPNACHKCGLPVAPGESTCSCRSVNLNW